MGKGAARAERKLLEVQGDDNWEKVSGVLAEAEEYRNRLQIKCTDDVSGFTK